MKFVFAFFLTVLIIQGAFSQNGVIRELTGTVEIQQAGSAAFVAASTGTSVSPNTVISTGFRSTAIIEVGSSVVTVRPLTRLTFAEIRTMNNDENVSMNLQTGRVRVDVNPPAGTRTNFNVSSPSATASVRGTSFEFDTVNITVDEGRVVFSGTSGGPAVLVTAGNTTFSDSYGKPADPVEVAISSMAPIAPIGAPPPIEAPSFPVHTDIEGTMDVNVVY